MSFPVAMSFTEKPKGSKETIHQLSRVNLRTDIRFLTIVGEMRMWFNWKGGREVEPAATTGMDEPLPTVILEG